MSSDASLTLLAVLTLACFVYAGMTFCLLRRDASRRPLACKLSFKLFMTAGDFVSDVVYMATSMYYSLTVWAVSLFFTVAPTFFFFFCSGAHRTPWLTYAYCVCKTVRGRKLWRDGRLQFGLAIEFKSWDSALAVLSSPKRRSV